MGHAALMAGIEALGQAQDSQALVTVAIFGGEELANANTLNDGIQPVLNDVLGRPKPPRAHERRPYVISVKAGPDLPLDVPSIAASAGVLGPRISGATHVAIIRYAGPTLPGHVQVTATLKAAAVLASSENHVLIDLSTRQIYDALGWARWVDRPDVMTAQVRPGAERGPDGVTLFSRGMAKFGLPDLEIYGLPEQAARSRFKGFQKAIQGLRTRHRVKVGDTYQGQTLAACKRVPEAIEAGCVRLP